MSATPLWTGDALAAATGGRLTRGFAVAGISIDSRTVRRGDLFVALVGERDGHDHVADALARGAAGAMVHATDGLPDDAPLLVVGDTLAGLTALGAAGRDRARARVVAVTGSVGKTTTKEMLRSILATVGPTHAAVASYNNHWGVPLTLARLPADAAFAVIEIGMNHAGEIAPLARLARPDVAVITAIAPAHIGHLGTIEAIADEKASIAEGLPADGVLVLPADSPHLDRMRRAAGGRRVATFGIDAGDLRCFSRAGDASGSDVIAQHHGHRLVFHLAAPGEHMIADALAALAGAIALTAGRHVAPSDLAAALASFTPVTGRGARRDLLDGAATLLDESYNASAPAVRAALDVLRLMPARRRIVVLGDMLELGDHAVAEHEGLADDVARTADMFFACGPAMRCLFERIPERLRAAHRADSATLAPLVAAAMRPGDAVLVKGSLGSRMRVVVQALEARA